MATRPLACNMETELLSPGNTLSIKNADSHNNLRLFSHLNYHSQSWVLPVPSLASKKNITEVQLWSVTEISRSPVGCPGLPQSQRRRCFIGYDGLWTGLGTKKPAVKVVWKSCPSSFSEKERDWQNIISCLDWALWSHGLCICFLNFSLFFIHGYQLLHESVPQPSLWPRQIRATNDLVGQMHIHTMITSGHTWEWTHLRTRALCHKILAYKKAPRKQWSSSCPTT